MNAEEGSAVPVGEPVTAHVAEEECDASNGSRRAAANKSRDTNSISAAAAAYVAEGFFVVPLRRGEKAPASREWSLKSNCIGPGDPLPTTMGGVGLAHVYSRTCVIDVDDLTKATALLKANDVDLQKFLDAPDAVKILSGRPGRTKLLYRLPEGMAAPHSINRQSDGIELRCATRKGTTTQDVLPPSVHPTTGQPYTWAGDWRELPTIPAELMDCWLRLLRHDAGRAASANGPVLPVLVESALASLDPDMAYDDWLKVGMALASAGLGDKWEQWSRAGTKYREGDCDARLAGFDPEGGVGLGTLYHLAHEAGWQPKLDEFLPAIEALPHVNDAASALAAALRTVSAGDAERGIAEKRLAKHFHVRLKDFAADVKKALVPAGTAEGGDLIGRYAYVVELDRIADARTGSLYRPEAFDRMLLRQYPSVKATATLCAHPNAILVHNVTWHPGAPILIQSGDRQLFNLYRPPTMQPKRGDVRPWLTHLRYLLPERAQRHQLIRWMAFVVQQPGHKPNWQVLMAGRPRVGKDTAFVPIVRFLGDTARVISGQDLRSSFNEYLQATRLLVVEEVMNFQRRDLEFMLKTICASPPETLSINRKGVSSFSVPNIVAVVFFSNSREALSISDREEGRYFALWIDADRREDAYYAALHEWYDVGGVEAVIDFLLRLSLVRFAPRGNAPRTPFLEEIIRDSVPEKQAELRDAIDEGRAPFDRDVVTAEALWSDAHGFPAETWVRRMFRSQKDLAKHLRSAGAVTRKLRFRSGDRVTNRTIWVLRNTSGYVSRSDPELAALAGLKGEVTDA